MQFACCHAVFTNQFTVINYTCRLFIELAAEWAGTTGLKGNAQYHSPPLKMVTIYHRILIKDADERKEND
jgi:hypothetical protein